MISYDNCEYDLDSGDGAWNGTQIADLVTASIHDINTIESYADIRCGDGSVMSKFRNEITGTAPISRVVGYDLGDLETLQLLHPDVEYKCMHFSDDHESFDLITLNNVIEHVAAPHALLSACACRSRYVALHIPLEDRTGFRLTPQYNYRLNEVGHISFWNVATALNTLTASGLIPIQCKLTPGFQAPTDFARWSQRVAFPFRWMLWKLNPALLAATLGGVSLAVVCKGMLDEVPKSPGRTGGLHRNSLNSAPHFDGPPDGLNSDSLNPDLHRADLNRADPNVTRRRLPR